MVTIVGLELFKVSATTSLRSAGGASGFNWATITCEKEASCRARESRVDSSRVSLRFFLDGVK